VRPYFIESGGNALVAVKAAADLKSRDREHDEFWCVCDADDTSAGDLSAARDLALKVGIELCLSTRCFEVWLACHWGKISTAPVMTEADARQLVGKHHPPYLKGPKFVPFRLLSPLTVGAIANAKWLEGQDLQNPATDVHRLIEKLIERLPK
jgi:hypothetical protein